MIFYSLSRNNPFSNSEEKYLDMTKTLATDKACAMTHSELESYISDGGRELMRRMLQDHLVIRGLGAKWHSIKGSDGIERSYKQVSTRTLITVFGKVQIKRVGYYIPGIKSLYPMDGNLNLPRDIYSYGIRKMVALEAAKNSFSEVKDTLARNTSVTISKRQIEKLVKKSAQDFDGYYKKNIPDGLTISANTSPILVVTTDGKGIVVRKEDLREQTKQALETSQKKLNKRISKGEKKNRKRMATVASVYDIERYPRTPQAVCGDLGLLSNEGESKRPSPQRKRVWASLEKAPDDVIDEVFEEALRRDPERRSKWVCLVDGDRNQIKRIKRKAKEKKVNIVIILDIIHVIEYLWRSARVFHEEASKEAEKWVTKRLLAILQGKAGLVGGGMRRSATLLKITDTKRKPVDSCASYLLGKLKYLRYDEYLREGFPIATGVIEGACRHLIKDRMDITGARWSLDGAEAILKLRSLKSSGDFDDYWKYHEQQQFNRNHASLYCDSNILCALSVN